MNKRILDTACQEFISTHLNNDVHAIAMGKSKIDGVSAAELAIQISAKRKCAKKLPTWYNTKSIYYPPPLSIEQTSSETTARYKAELAFGNSLIDLTGGFGVDGYFFSLKVSETTHCEINAELLEIAAYNAKVLGQHNTAFKAADGLKYLLSVNKNYGTIYVDPARRSSSGKVFKLRDCTPDVTEHLDILLERCNRVIIKTAPLLDISAGLKELKNVAEIHIVSVKNECKELLWMLQRAPVNGIKVTAVTLNAKAKSFSFLYGLNQDSKLLDDTPSGYLYEPDAALLKSGAFNLIGEHYRLTKLDALTQLYVSATINEDFPGRIFEIKGVYSSAELKKRESLYGNVMVRNYRDKPEQLIRKFKIKPHDTNFFVFTHSNKDGFIILEAEILQHY